MQRADTWHVMAALRTLSAEVRELAKEFNELKTAIGMMQPGHAIHLHMASNIVNNQEENESDSDSSADSTQSAS